ncbi:MAG: metal-dependent transcriptional regulator [Lachnospiraceae bacterium]|nr:metal-dependent transcriptional regulator [Lachnospiraceae bacterium]
MVIHESAEDYLEAVLMLSEKNVAVRSIDVAAQLGFSKPSVSIAMKKLRENGYVVMDASGFIKLTESGRAIAESTYEKHKVISKVLIAMGVPADIALQDACRMEHTLSPQSFEAIKKYVTEQGLVLE